jgi:curved DNA-binding protein CbpA
MSPVEAAAVLGVALDASSSDIQHAFLRLARVTHPDVLADASEADRRDAGLRFADLKDARDALLSARPRGEASATGWVEGAGLASQTRPAGAVPGQPTFRRVRSRGMAGSIIALILLAVLLVATVSAQDAFRTSTIVNINTPAP